VSELYRPSELRLSAKLVATFAGRGCHVVSVTDPYGRILGFLDLTVTGIALLFLHFIYYVQYVFYSTCSFVC
jgi:hypothetical protein